jgi:hypothetical protein
MRQALRLHPDSRCAAVTRIEVGLERPAGGELAMRYVVTGRIGDLRLPQATAPQRADGLWRSTCFEAFLRTGTDGRYYELNFAPSTQWAAYRFDDYRSGMRVADELAAPRIDTQSGRERYELRAVIGLPGERPWRLGLSAVIEEADGTTSYWALKHPPGKPDFHHADCFALELPALVQP